MPYSLSSAGTVHAVRTREMWCFVPLPIASRAPVVRCSPLQSVEHAHHDAMPGRTAQTSNPQSVPVEVLPVHGNEALTLRAQARQVQLLSFQRPHQGVLKDACAFGSRARHRLCSLQTLYQYSQNQ